MKTKTLFITIFMVFVLPISYAATIHGTVYDQDLEEIENIQITINTIPEQNTLSTNGDYSFEVGTGTYILIFEYSEGGYYYEEEIYVMDDGDYLMDMILFPDLDTIDDDTFDIQDPYNVNNYSIIFLFVIGIILAYYILRKFKKPKEKKTSLEEDEIEKVLGFIEKEGGRTTQKDIRKNLLLSEAKASLILTELEYDKKIRRIKKGRGNIISLNKKS